MNLMQSYSVVILLFNFFMTKLWRTTHERKGKQKKIRRNQPTNKTLSLSLFLVWEWHCAGLYWYISLENQIQKIEHRFVYLIRRSFHLPFDRLCVGRLLYICRVCIMKNYYDSTIWLLCVNFFISLSNSLTTTNYWIDFMCVCVYVCVAYLSTRVVWLSFGSGVVEMLSFDIIVQKV